MQEGREINETSVEQNLDVSTSEEEVKPMAVLGMPSCIYGYRVAAQRLPDRAGFRGISFDHLPEKYSFRVQ